MALVFWRIGTVPMNLPTGALLISQIANVVYSESFGFVSSNILGIGALELGVQSLAVWFGGFTMCLSQKNPKPQAYARIRLNTEWLEGPLLLPLDAWQNLPG